MQRIIQSLAAIALATASLAHAADLTVPAGQTYVISAAQSDLRLERLTLGDNARITFAPGVSSWRVYAKQANVGQNVVIDGRGAEGANGGPGSERSGRAKSCDEGKAGGAGGAGGKGGNGVAMNLWLGIEKLGSLSIQADGGNGGAGGKGGRGQDGGQVNRCEGPQGGAGGAGGVGGDGGKGGDVILAYHGVALGDRIRLSSLGGQPGAGGPGGAGGAGSDGAFQRTPAGDHWFRGGRPGAVGGAGSAGRAGADGMAQVQVAAANTGPAWRDEISSAPAPTVAVLQQQVQALQASSTVIAPSGQTESLPDLIKRLQQRVDELEQRVRILEKR